MPYKRTDRVNALLRQELQQLIQSELTDPRIGFATVTGVEVSADLRHARVFVSVMAEAEQREASLRALEDARHFLRHELAGRTELRYVPELTFKLDRSIEQATRISELLREAKPRE
jgi:ribosome-binding factor A